MTESRDQVLISKLVDGEASQDDWQEFAARADADPSLWKQVAESQRDHHVLVSVIETAGEVAELVSVPPLRLRNVNDGASRKTAWPVPRLTAWSGWAVAALITIVATVRMAEPLRRSPLVGPDHTQSADLTPFTAAEAYQAYLDQGREAGAVFGEWPEYVLLDTRPVKSGEGYELLFLRQILERTVVPDLYHFGASNELGQPVLVRLDQPVQGDM